MPDALRCRERITANSWMLSPPRTSTCPAGGSRPPFVPLHSCTHLPRPVLEAQDQKASSGGLGMAAARSLVLGLLLALAACGGHPLAS